MSWQAVKWAIHDAPVDDAAVLMVLVAICDRADSDGRNAFPSMAWVAHRARCSVRTAHRRLAVLRKEGLVVEGDQSLVAGFRADRRPCVFDVDMTRTRGMTHLTPREPDWDDSTASGGAHSTTSRHDTSDTPQASPHDGDDMTPASRRDTPDMPPMSVRNPRHDRSGSDGMTPVADKPALPPTEVNQPKTSASAPRRRVPSADPVQGELLDVPTKAETPAQQIHRLTMGQVLALEQAKGSPLVHRDASIGVYKRHIRSTFKAGHDEVFIDKVLAYFLGQRMPKPSDGQWEDAVGELVATGSIRGRRANGRNRITEDNRVYIDNPDTPFLADRRTQK